MAVAAPPIADLTLRPSRPRRSIVGAGVRRDALGSLLGASALLSTLLVVCALLWILGVIVLNGVPMIDWEFLSASPTGGEGGHYGIFPTIVGSLSLVTLMVLLALPLGVMAAVYLTEYATHQGYARLIRAAVNNLAGVPSIVFGLFGVGFFVLFIGRAMDRINPHYDPSSGAQVLIYGQPAIFWAACTLACLVLPIIIVSTEEALRAVPNGYREAALALGASKWQTIRDVVLPQARGGILTGAILAVSRGAGETAPILFTGAAYFLPHLPFYDWNGVPILNPWSQFMEMAYHIFVLATQSTNPEAVLPRIFGTTLVLITITFGFNALAIWARYSYRRQLAKHL